MVGAVLFYVGLARAENRLIVVRLPPPWRIFTVAILPLSGGSAGRPGRG
jgi:hypothetical protein